MDGAQQARITLLRAATSLAAPGLAYELVRELVAAGEAREAADVFNQAAGRRPYYEVLPVSVADAADRRRFARALIDSGAPATALLAELAVCEAVLGNETATRRLVDYERHFRTKTVETTALGKNFLEGLAEELRAELTYYDETEGRAIRRAWRHNGLEAAASPRIHALMTLLRGEVEAYIRSLSMQDGHPFEVARPSGFELEAWAVVSGSEGHHLAHIHPRAWASGVFYVVQPPASRTSRRGWMNVGPPAHLGAERGRGWEERDVEPTPGKLVLMPAYYFHSTTPIGVDEERICVAFDVVPKEG